MNLHGWDTISAISMELANLGLAGSRRRLPTHFDHKHDKVRIKGRFGNWRIVPGGSIRRIHMEIDIETGAAQGTAGTGLRRRVPLNGSVLSVEIPLDLVPSPDGVKPVELRFKYNPDGVQDLVLPLGFADASGKLDEVQADMIQYALSDCLSQNIKGIGHVFAQIDPKSLDTGSWAGTPHLDWAWLETGDKRRYLAILGCLTPPTEAMNPEKIDPDLIGSDGSAFMALSHRLYESRLLLPYMQANFKPKARFAHLDPSAKVKRDLFQQATVSILKVAGFPSGVVSMTKPVKLAMIKSPIGKLYPVLTQLILGPMPFGLRIMSQTEISLGIGGTMYVRVNLNIRAALGKNGQIVMKPDPKPEVTHEVAGAGLLSKIVGAIVDLIMGLSGTSVKDIAASVARSMQGINIPAGVPAQWAGVRPFQTTAFKQDACLWFCDARPVGPGLKTAPRPVREPAD